MAEVPRRLVDRPGHARLLVRSHEHSAPLLPQIELAVEVDDVDHFLAGGLVDRRDLRHVLGDEVHVLHREHRQLEPDHAPHLARPEAGRVDDVLGVDVSLVRDHPPQALTGAGEILHLGVAIDLGAELAGGAGVRVGDPRGVDMAVDEGLHAAHEALGIEERHELVRFLGTDDLRLDPEVAPFRDEPLDPLEALLRRREHDPARHVQAGCLARQLLELPVDLDRVLLELRDVGIAVDGVHASRRVPGGPGGELGAFHEHHVGPAELGEMVEDRAADHAAPDHDHARVRLHVSAFMSFW